MGSPMTRAAGGGSASDRPEVEAATDGRRARADRNREAVVDAILGLLREGNSQPSAADIAERAGVSLRSVFRHFDDLDTLHAVAVERHQASILPLFELQIPEPPSGVGWAPVDERVASFVAQRAALLEEMRPVRSVAERLRDRSAPIAEGLERARRFLRGQVRRMFEPELERCAPAERRDLFDALEAATSFAMWQQLRTEQGLSKARAAAAVERSLRGLLARDG